MSSININGVRFINKKKYAICFIDFLSDEIKEIIRTELSSICHGASKASKARKAYTYKATVKSFLERYERKTATTKVGMIGELLTHVFIIKFLENFNTVSPFFNMEEKSIKKGFDILMYSTVDEEIWITEVKSGELHHAKDSNDTNKALLSKAKLDLKNRLNENESSLWENAINGATIALDNLRDAKDAVIAILDDIEDEIVENRAASENKNVILVTSLFSTLNDEIKDQTLQDFFINTINEKIFKNVIVFSIQKNTYIKVVEFLREEAQ